MKERGKRWTYIGRDRRKKEERKKGSKGGREEGRKGGREEGRKGGRQEGRKVRRRKKRSRKGKEWCMTWDGFKWMYLKVSWGWEKDVAPFFFKFQILWRTYSLLRRESGAANNSSIQGHESRKGEKSRGTILEAAFPKGPTNSPDFLFLLFIRTNKSWPASGSIALFTMT